MSKLRTWVVILRRFRGLRVGSRDCWISHEVGELRGGELTRPVFFFGCVSLGKDKGARGCGDEDPTQQS